MTKKVTRDPTNGIKDLMRATQGDDFDSYVKNEERETVMKDPNSE